MNTLTIPTNLIKEKDLVLIPRKLYERLLRSTGNKDMVVKRDASFKVPKKHEKFYNELDKELTVAVREIKAGKNLSDTFYTAEEAFKFLDSRNKVSKHK